MFRVWVALLLLPAASAQDILYGHSTEGGLVVSPDPEDPRRDGDVAVAQTVDGAAVWTFRMDPAAGAVWLLGGNVTARVGIGAETGSGNVEVAWTLTSGTTVLAHGPAKEVLYTIDYEEVMWDVPLEETTHDPRAGDLWWNVTATGTHSQIFLAVGGADRSMVELPVEERRPIAQRPPLELRNVTGGRVGIEWGFDEPADRHVRYAWSPPGTFELRFRAALGSGTAWARLADGGNETRWQASWPGDGNGTVLLRNGTGNWTLELLFTQAVGSLDVVLERVQAQTTTTRTERGSPAPGPLLLLAALAAARRWP